MKRSCYCFFILLFLNAIKVEAQIIHNTADCEYPHVVCGGSYGTTGPYETQMKGFGVQNLTKENSCGGIEHNSVWQEVTFKTSGTFGFDIRPLNNYGFGKEWSDVDYDFYVFGPNPVCSNLDSAIRCCTTDSKKQGLPDTYTGMNEQETDTHETPADKGNSYVRWIDVKAGETYLILIDVKENDILNRDFYYYVDFTGTARTVGVPTINLPPNGSLNQEQCDTDGVNNNSTTFDLTTYQNVVLKNQTDLKITYHTNINDIYKGENSILNPSAFVNTSNPQTLYMRVAENLVYCYSYKEFTITVVDNNAKFVTTQSAICDDALDGNDSNGKTVFNFNKVTSDILGNIDTSGLTIQYYLIQNDALLGINPLPNLYYNAIPNQQSVFVTVSGANYCSKEPKEIQLIVNPLPAKKSYTLTQCEVGTNPDGLTLYNLKEADLALTNNDSNLSVKYFLNATQETNNNPLPYNYTNMVNPQQIIARITNETTKCSSLGELTLKTRVINEAAILLQECDILGQENGFAVFNLGDANLGLSPTQTIKYYPSLNDALLEEKTITNFANYTNKTVYFESVFARIEENNACYGIAEIQLKVNKLPNIITEGKDFLCSNIPNDSVLLSADLITGNSVDYSYKWFRNGQVLPQTSYGIQTTQTGTYSVEVINGENCSKTRNIEVAQSSNATITDVEIADINTDFNSVKVIVSGIGKYSYSLDEPNGRFQSSNFFENVPAGIHEVYVYDENGCGTISKTIAVIGIPKFFTPNGDGYNDFWKIKGVDAIFNVATNVFIFDRYGKLLKQIPIGDYNGWDGNFNEKPLPADDYWYNINLADGRVVKGHFALKR
jgi:gliding motility-associated-like protein